MKLGIIQLEHGNIQLEIIGETEFETKVLQANWEHCELSRGNGNSVLDNGYNTGFYIDLLPSPKDKK